MADAVSISALILAVLSGASQLLVGIRMKHCESTCFSSDCIPSSPTKNRTFSDAPVGVIQSRALELAGGETISEAPGLEKQGRREAEYVEISTV
jgi:hypothetical protein